MGIANNGVDHVSAPADYADLFRKYYDYVVTLVRRNGIEENRKEDVACDILLRFYERDFLAKFDPTLVFHYDGQDRPARFKSFLTKFVLTYVRGYRDKHARLAARELLICDMPIGVSRNTGDTLATWVEVFGDPTPGAEADVVDALDEADLVAELRAHIATVPRRSKYDTCDLVVLFDAVIEQIRADGAWNVAELRARFGVSSTAMHSWMWWLRANLAAALGRPVPAKRPRTMPLKDRP